MDKGVDFLKGLSTVKKVLLLASLLVLALVPEAGAADSKVQVVIADTAANTGCLRDKAKSYAPPVWIDDQLLVPLRAAAESLKLAISWDDQQRTIRLRHNEQSITLVPEQTTVILNNKAVTLATPPTIIGQSAFVPPEFFSLLGYYVHYQQDFNGKPTLWILPYQPINAKEYNNLAEAYIKSTDSEIAPGWSLAMYRLRREKATVKGIRLGDNISEIKAAYGTPFSDQIDNVGNGTLLYTYLPEPNSQVNTGMLFVFKQSGLVKVLIF